MGAALSSEPNPGAVAGEEGFMVPATMKAVFLTTKVPKHSKNPEDYNGHFEVRELPTPKLESGDLLVKVERTPINPSDLSIITGTYNAKAAKPLPCQLGLEGSGLVVAVGGGPTTWTMLGKRVAINSKNSSMWAEYCVADSLQSITLPPEATYEQASSCFVNPLTVLSFIDIAKQADVTTVLISAAASAVGKQLIQLGKIEGIEVIGTVRKQDQKKELLDLGAKAVVVTEGDAGAGEQKDADWKRELAELCTQHDVRVAFDAVAGDLTGQLLRAMPARSTIYVYGGLSLKPVGAIAPSDLIFQEKQVKGFWLVAYLRERNLLVKANFLRKVQQHTSGVLAAKVRKSYPMDMIGQALADYNSDMGGGKICLAPSMPLSAPDAYVPYVWPEPGPEGAAAPGGAAPGGAAAAPAANAPAGGPRPGLTAANFTTADL